MLTPKQMLRQHKWFKFKALPPIYWLRTFTSKMSQPELLTWTQGIVDAMKHEGIAIANIEDIWPGQLESLQTYFAHLRAGGGITNSFKPFWTDLWPRDVRLSSYNPFVELCFKVLPLANAYHGMWTRMYSLRALITRVAEQPEMVSQLWHRDHEDIRIFKFFLYLNDVDENNGPFEYVKGSHMGGKHHKLIPMKGPPFGTRVHDPKIIDRFAGEDIIKCTGKAGTIIIADTAGLHRGGFCKSGERELFMCGFISNGRHRQKYRAYKINLIVNHSNASASSKSFLVLISMLDLSSITILPVLGSSGNI